MKLSLIFISSILSASATGTKCSTTAAEQSTTTTTVEPAPPRARVEVYYETRCPASRSFFNYILPDFLSRLPETEFVPKGSDAFTLHFKSFDLVAVPFGNASLTKGCQRGVRECQLNTVAYNLWKHQDEGIPEMRNKEFVELFKCFFDNNGDDQWKTCFNFDMTLKAKMAYFFDMEFQRQDAIQACKALVPKHEYVPWVLVNGTQIGYGELATAMCGTHVQCK